MNAFLKARCNAVTAKRDSTSSVNIFSLVLPGNCFHTRTGFTLQRKEKSYFSNSLSDWSIFFSCICLYGSRDPTWGVPGRKEHKVA